MGGIVKGIGSIFSSPEAPTPAPTPTAPVTPEADDEALMQSRRRAAAALQNRSGRSSTLMSDASATTNKLGG